LSVGERIYSYLNSVPGQLLTTSPFAFYPEDKWRDDLTFGATQLYLAATAAQKAGVPTLKPASFYLTDAQYWATEYLNRESWHDTINLYDIGGLAFYELVKALNATNQCGSFCTTMINNRKGVVDRAISQSRNDPFGFPTTAYWDTSPHLFGYAAEASFLAEMLPSQKSTYVAFGQMQRNWLFGANAWGASMIIGAGSNYAHCPQHQVANLVGSLDGSSPMLWGAVVSGPSNRADFNDIGIPSGSRRCPSNGVDRYNAFTSATKNARFMDDVRAWPSVEPANDFAALQVLLWARYIKGK